MEKTFESSFINKIIGFFSKIMTSNTSLNVMRGLSGGKLIKIPKHLLDISGTRLLKQCSIGITHLIQFQANQSIIPLLL